MNKSSTTLILHGLGNSKYLMSPLSYYLSLKGFDTLNLGYPSCNFNSEDLADKIAKILLQKVSADTFVNIVGFSLGTQIARVIIHNYYDKIKFSRLVMIAPPNQGSEFARLLRRGLPTERIWGPVFNELCDNILPNPCTKLDVGVIAGANGLSIGFNPTIKGDNDGIVALKETYIEGSKEHKTIFGIHGTMPIQPKVMRLCANFLSSGSFS